MRILSILVMIAALICTSPALAVEIGDAAKGLRYATDNCTGCHAVFDNETISPNPHAPSFKAVANTPGMTGIALMVWFRTPHRTMPNFVIRRDDTEDLIAFILSLRDRY